MFQFDFGRRIAAQRPTEAVTPDGHAVESVGVTFWEEHCLECAQPECFKSCPLYVRRPDENCARFSHGICENHHFEGLSPSGAEIRFRQWGKLQTSFGPGSLNLHRTRNLIRFDSVVSRLAVSTALNRGPLRGRRSLNPQRYYQYARKKLLERIMRRDRHEEFTFDELLIDVWNLGDRPFRLFVEAHESVSPVFREAIRLDSGRTVSRIPFRELNLRPWGEFPHLRRLVLFPEDNAECHVVFTWLDLVRYQNDKVSDDSSELAGVDDFRAGNAIPTPDPGKSRKVKCVVWDLDNTVWRGILVEDGIAGIRLREEVRRLFDQFDRRGILQSVASKNDHEHAWKLLQNLGIADYFLYPQINWGPKSKSMEEIAGALNIGIDSLVLIDDSPFERAEVRQRWPAVRVYDAVELETLLDRPEFDVPVTQEGRMRREMYRTEQRRHEAESESADGYDAFLKSCQIEVRLFRPADDAEIARCSELLQRTNQLNLSGNRYQADDLRRLLADDRVQCVAVSCRDRFGDYGLVGFLSIRLENEIATITDLALSCRIAQKTVEHAIIDWLLSILRSRHINNLQAKYVPTDRNQPLQAVLSEIGFVEGNLANPGLHISVDTIVARSEIVSIDASGVTWS